MVAELPGAATVEAMSRPEQEEAEEVFEEARGEALSQSELMAGGPVPLVGGQVPYSQLFVPTREAPLSATGLRSDFRTPFQGPPIDKFCCWML